MQGIQVLKDANRGGLLFSWDAVQNKLYYFVTVPEHLAHEQMNALLVCDAIQPALTEGRHGGRAHMAQGQGDLLQTHADLSIISSLAQSFVQMKLKA